jgi:hypothetical protein
MTKISETTEWRIRIPKDRMNALKSDEPFRQILVLGRMLNSLRVLEITYLADAQTEKPAGARQRIGAFLFIAGVLFEGLQLTTRLGRHFRKNKAWQGRIVPLLSSHRFERLFSGNLKPIRDQAVFHFFEDSYADPLKEFDLEEIIVVTGYGKRQGQIYYELSDLLAIDLFTGPAPSADEQIARAKQLIEATKDLLLDLIHAGEAVIAEYCRSQGFIREVKDASGTWRAA